jgi:hypothetical protein
MSDCNKVIKTWKGNQNNTILFTIPTVISKQYGLDQPSYVVVEPMEKGIFLRKLEVSKDV